jgi:hypothetical protein
VGRGWRASELINSRHERTREVGSVVVSAEFHDGANLNGTRCCAIYLLGPRPSRFLHLPSLEAQYQIGSYAPWRRAHLCPSGALGNRWAASKANAL